MAMEADTKSALRWVALFVIVLCGSLFAVSRISNAEDERLRFEGACTVLHGKVAGDVCIKDNTVILWKKDMPK